MVRSDADGESDLAVGRRLDRYELLTPIASGGMAAVWLARLQGKRGFEKLVAIKTIKAELSDDPHFEEMFLDEARIASGIQHPNVAHIIDLGEQNEILYLVMEWVDGESIARLRKAAAKAGATVPLGVTLRMLADACAGLHAAHELRDKASNNLGIVHRDVSPQNILVSSSGMVKVIDFGIAKAKNRMAKETGTGVVKGKLAYMAPEQALGKPVDRRADVWAIGVCLYELVSGVLPFDGDNQLELFAKVTGTAKRPPIEGVTHAEVDEILDTALARDPDHRYPTAAAMQRALEHAIVALDLDGSHEAIAKFVETHLADRLAKRQGQITRALESAAARMPTAPGPRSTTEELSLSDALADVTPLPPIGEMATVAAGPTPPHPKKLDAKKPDAQKPESKKPALRLVEDGEPAPTFVPVAERTSARISSAAAAPIAPREEWSEPTEPAPKRRGTELFLLLLGVLGVGYFVWRMNVIPGAGPANDAPAVSSSSEATSSDASTAPSAPPTITASESAAIIPSASVAPSVSVSVSVSVGGDGGTTAPPSASVPRPKLPFPLPPPTTTATATTTAAPTETAPPVPTEPPPDEPDDYK